MKTYKIIREHTALPELYAYLAEEAAELSRVALEYRRLLLSDDQNEEALRDLIMKYASVVCTMSVTGVDDKAEYYDLIEKTVRHKAELWAACLAEPKPEWIQLKKHTEDLENDENRG